MEGSRCCQNQDQLTLPLQSSGVANTQRYNIKDYREKNSDKEAIGITISYLFINRQIPLLAAVTADAENGTTCLEVAAQAALLRCARAHSKSNPSTSPSQSSPPL